MLTFIQAMLVSYRIHSKSERAYLDVLHMSANMRLVSWRVHRLKPLLAAALLISLSAGATPVTGHLTSPAGALPALHVYAWATSGHLVATATSPGQNGFHLELPPGQYRFFATPADPGVPLVYAGHTGCGSAEDGLPNCSRHQLRLVTIGRDTSTPIEIDDWRLDDDQALQLDRVLHHPEGAGESDPGVGAPRFFEYPAEPMRRAHANILSTQGVAEAERKPLLDALRSGHINFAGRAAVVSVPCGTGCNAARIVDLVTGRVTPVPLGAAAIGPFACTQHYAYRRDSRLLRVGFDNGEGDLADAYYAWEPETGLLHPVGTLPAGRCAPRPVDR
jgi:hypothetical protein